MFAGLRHHVSAFLFFFNRSDLQFCDDDGLLFLVWSNGLYGSAFLLDNENSLIKQGKKKILK